MKLNGVIPWLLLTSCWCLIGLFHGNYGNFSLFLRSASRKGVTVPTELVDMNNDGVDDLIVFMYNGTITVLNGVNLEVMWSTGSRFSQFETYR